MNIELELKKMKKELKSALDADEKSRNAMDELASVLREVAAEASKAKEDLRSTQLELKAAKEDKEQMGLELTTALAECKTLKNAEERIRMEADEMLAAWNEKESGLVGCLKDVEKERSRERSEKLLLQEEMKKLRDILKQAMAEAATAKEEASIVRGENLKLNDQLAGKDTALNFISRELESLRASEAGARGSLADLKLQLAESSSESRNSYMEKQEEIKAEEYKKVKKTFSFDMRCTGRKKGLEDMVDRKATKVARGGSMRRDKSYRFPDERRRSSERQNPLTKKAFFKRFGELVSSSKSRTQKI
ncbi:hypothetical protein QQ045_010966 [Rhodiola kirilowii]